MRIPGTRDYQGLVELAQYLPADVKVMAEIGSHIGGSAGIFIAHLKPEKIYCVDSWHDGPQREWEFDRFARPHPQVVKVKLDTAAGASQFKDFSLDFVYIDADHSYAYVRRDIALWTPKVRIGGWIGGHDYVWRFPGVLQSVHERFVQPDHVFADTSWLVHLTGAAKV
jgi:predicted O-methyltransferase YrrM